MSVVSATPSLPHHYCTFLVVCCTAAVTWSFPPITFHGLPSCVISNDPLTRLLSSWSCDLQSFLPITGCSLLGHTIFNHFLPITCYNCGLMGHIILHQSFLVVVWRVTWSPITSSYCLLFARSNDSWPLPDFHTDIKALTRDAWCHVCICGSSIPHTCSPTHLFVMGWTYVW